MFGAGDRGVDRGASARAPGPTAATIASEENVARRKSATTIRSLTWGLGPCVAFRNGIEWADEDERSQPREAG